MNSEKTKNHFAYEISYYTYTLTALVSLHHQRFTAPVWNKQNAIPPMMLNRPIGAWITLITDSRDELLMKLIDNWCGESLHDALLWSGDVENDDLVATLLEPASW